MKISESLKLVKELYETDKKSFEQIKVFKDKLERVGKLFIVIEINLEYLIRRNVSIVMKNLLKKVGI